MKKPLAVGDRVRVYGINGNGVPIHRDTTITGFSSEGAVYVVEGDCYKSGNSGYDLTMPHVKQCRRLLRKPRKVYYGVVRDKGTAEGKEVMKLHEALSTGLPIRRDSFSVWLDNNEFFARCMSFSYDDVMSEWQVRLPDGTVTDSYAVYLSDVAAATTPRGENPRSTLDVLLKGPEASNIPVVTRAQDGGWDVFLPGGLKLDCECGSEAIGGGAHSNWCPRSQG